MHPGAQAGGGRIANQGDNGYPEEVRGLGMSLFPGVFSSGGPPGPAGMRPCESQCRTVARTARGGPARSAIAPWAGNRWDRRRQVERRALSGSTTISRRVEGAGGPATTAEPSAKRARWMLRRTRIARLLQRSHRQAWGGPQRDTGDG